MGSACHIYRPTYMHIYSYICSNTVKYLKILFLIEASVPPKYLYLSIRPLGVTSQKTGLCLFSYKNVTSLKTTSVCYKVVFLRLMRK